MESRFSQFLLIALDAFLDRGTQWTFVVPFAFAGTLSVSIAEFQAGYYANTSQIAAMSEPHKPNMKVMAAPFQSHFFQ